MNLGGRMFLSCSAGVKGNSEGGGTAGFGAPLEAGAPSGARRCSKVG